MLNNVTKDTKQSKNETFGTKVWNQNPPEGKLLVGLTPEFLLDENDLSVTLI